MVELRGDNHPLIAGIILAAGGASRMGQPKLLLSWNGETLIHRSARTALEAGLRPLVVVTGAEAGEIMGDLQDLPLQFVHNPDWRKGQSTSVRAGIRSLSKDTSAVVFLLGDQPFISPELIQKLMSTYLQEHPVILAPFVGGKRANPVLFDHSLFGRMCRLEGDAGARSLFGEFPPAALPWLDERILFDIDTPEDYQRLLGMK
jgi:molybdenum cofactor cytidylyltransferase